MSEPYPVTEGELPPKVSPVMSKLIDISGLHWAICGGLKVGNRPAAPRVWRLRPMGEVAMVRQHTKDLQKSANAHRELHRAKERIKELEAKYES